MRELMQPLVSVIVVTLNNTALLRNCLASLATQTWRNTQIVVVDNGSGEDVRGMVAKEFPAVQLLRFEQNLGFAEGNNQGIRVAKGEYIALINNDAVASPQWLEGMVAAAQADARIGSVASVIVDGNNPAVYDSVGLGVALDGMARQVGKGEPLNDGMVLRDVLMPSGCACLLRREALDDVGLFDPDFFAYCEDSDLGLRLRLAGWDCVIARDAVVYHHYSQTFGRFSMKKVYWVERNHFWVFVKNYPLILWPILPFATLYRLLLQGFYFTRGSAATDGFKSEATLGGIAAVYVRAYWDMLLKLPSMLGKRFKAPCRIGMWRAALLLHRHSLTMRQILGVEN